MNRINGNKNFLNVFFKTYFIVEKKKTREIFYLYNHVQTLIYVKKNFKTYLKCSGNQRDPQEYQQYICHAYAASSNRCLTAEPEKRALTKPGQKG